MGIPRRLPLSSPAAFIAVIVTILLTFHLSNVSAQVTFTQGTTWTSGAAAAGSFTQFQITLCDGTLNAFSVQVEPIFGNPDVYVAYKSPPTLSSYDYKSTNVFGAEEVIVRRSAQNIADCWLYESCMELSCISSNQCLDKTWYIGVYSNAGPYSSSFKIRLIPLPIDVQAGVSTVASVKAGCIAYFRSPVTSQPLDFITFETIYKNVNVTTRMYVSDYSEIPYPDATSFTWQTTGTSQLNDLITIDASGEDEDFNLGSQIAMGVEGLFTPQKDFVGLVSFGVLFSENIRLPWQTPITPSIPSNKIKTLVMDICDRQNYTVSAQGILNQPQVIVTAGYRRDLYTAGTPFSLLASPTVRAAVLGGSVTDALLVGQVTQNGGYVYPPQVIISSTAGGRNARAVAQINTLGQVTRVLVTSFGSLYSSTTKPTITVMPPNSLALTKSNITTVAKPIKVNNPMPISSITINNKFLQSENYVIIRSASASTDTSANISYLTNKVSVCLVEPSVSSFQNPTLLTLFGRRFGVVSGKTANCGFFDSSTPRKLLPNGMVSAKIVSNTTLTCTPPKQTSALFGVVEVSLDSGTIYTKDSQSFKYFDDTYSVTSINPIAAPVTGGDVITITGQRFINSANAKCRFGTVSVPAFYVSSTTMQCTTIASASGFVNFSLSLGGVIFSTNTIRFQFFTNPVIKLITPTSGPTGGGTVISIVGDGFVYTGVKPVVKFYTTTISIVLEASDVVENNVYAKVPPVTEFGFDMTKFDATKGSFPTITVAMALNAKSYLEQTFQFRYYPSPTVQKVTPNVGSLRSGAKVTIVGSGFIYMGDQILCRFGSTSTDGKFLDSTRIQCASPTSISSTGQATISVAINGQNFTAATQFLETQMRLKSSYASNTASPQIKTNYGNLFAIDIARTSMTSVNKVAILEIRNGGLDTTVVQFQISTNDPIGTLNLLQTRLADYDSVLYNGAVTQFADNTVVMPNAGALTTFDATSVRLLSISPKSGPKTGNTRVTIVGTGFVSGAQLKCKFGTVVSDAFLTTSGNIECVSQPITTTTSTGNSISVLTTISLDGSEFSASSLYFLYYENPVVTSISPPLGAASQNNIFNVFGTGFLPSDEITCVFPGLKMVAIGSYHAANMIQCTTLPVDLSPYLGDSVNDNLSIALNGQQPVASNSAFTFYGDTLVSSATPLTSPSYGNVMVTVNALPQVSTNNGQCRFSSQSTKSQSFGYTCLPSIFLSTDLIKLDDQTVQTSAFSMALGFPPTNLVTVTCVALQTGVISLSPTSMTFTSTGTTKFDKLQSVAVTRVGYGSTSVNCTASATGGYSTVVKSSLMVYSLLRQSDIKVSTSALNIVGIGAANATFTDLRLTVPPLPGSQVVVTCRSTGSYKNYIYLSVGVINSQSSPTSSTSAPSPTSSSAVFTFTESNYKIPQRLVIVGNKPDLDGCGVIVCSSSPTSQANGYVGVQKSIYPRFRPARILLNGSLSPPAIRLYGTTPVTIPVRLAYQPHSGAIKLNCTSSDPKSVLIRGFVTYRFTSYSYLLPWNVPQSFEIVGSSNGGTGKATITCLIWIGTGGYVPLTSVSMNVYVDKNINNSVLVSDPDVVAVGNGVFSFLVKLSTPPRPSIPVTVGCSKSSTITSDGILVRGPTGSIASAETANIDLININGGGIGVPTVVTQTTLSFTVNSTATSVDWQRVYVRGNSKPQDYSIYRRSVICSVISGASGSGYSPAAISAKKVIFVTAAGIDITYSSLTTARNVVTTGSSRANNLVLTTSENVALSIYMNIALIQPPLATVTVTCTSSSPSDVSVKTTSISFTPSSWSLPIPYQYVLGANLATGEAAGYAKIICVPSSTGGYNMLTDAATFTVGIQSAIQQFNFPSPIESVLENTIAIFNVNFVTAPGVPISFNCSLPYSINPPLSFVKSSYSSGSTPTATPSPTTSSASLFLSSIGTLTADNIPVQFELKGRLPSSLNGGYTLTAIPITCQVISKKSQFNPSVIATQSVRVLPQLIAGSSLSASCNGGSCASLKQLLIDNPSNCTDSIDKKISSASFCLSLSHAPLMLPLNPAGIVRVRCTANFKQDTIWSPYASRDWDIGTLSSSGDTITPWTRLDNVAGGGQGVWQQEFIFDAVSSSSTFWNIPRRVVVSRLRAFSTNLIITCQTAAGSGYTTSQNITITTALPSVTNTGIIAPATYNPSTGSLSCQIPPSPAKDSYSPGMVVVEVSLDGNFFTRNVNTITYYPMPKILAVVPNAGPLTGGTLVRIYVANMTSTGDELCRFGYDRSGANGWYYSPRLAIGVVTSQSVPYTLQMPNSYTTATLTNSVVCITPPSYKGLIPELFTKVQLSLNSQDFTSNFLTYSYYSLPSIVSMFPSSGSSQGGTALAITGNNFSNYETSSTNHVACHLNDTSQVFTFPAVYINALSLSCTIPRGQSFKLGLYQFDVSLNGQDRTGRPIDFLIYSDPVITKIDVSNGPVTGGTLLSIVGENFKNTKTILCRFGSVTVSALYISDFVIACVTPSSSGGPQSVVVEVALNAIQFTSNPLVTFTFISSIQVTSIAPTTISLSDLETPVIVTGTGFDSRFQFYCRFTEQLTTITIGVAAPYKTSFGVVQSPTTLSCAVPTEVIPKAVLISISSNNQQFYGGVQFSYVPTSLCLTCNAAAPTKAKATTKPTPTKKSTPTPSPTPTVAPTPAPTSKR